MAKELKSTYCNPIPLENMPAGRWLDAFSDDPEHVRKIPDFRSVADPSAVYHNGKWILYPSYHLAWVSEDLVTWTPVDIGIPHLRWSPSVGHFRGKWYLSGHGMSQLYCADDPLGPFIPCGNMVDVYGRELNVADGCFFDDGDHFYFYYFGYEKAKPGDTAAYWTGTVGVELDPDMPWKAITEPVWINRFDPAKKWQCAGEHNEFRRGGYIEGQWMTKLNGRYYLLYSGSGTQYASYANGIAYSDEGPLSGFVPQKNHDPLTEKRSGLLRGAGHGSITEGPNGTHWIFYTTVYNFYHPYERRIGVDPIGVDKDGELFCPSVTETPQYAPGILAHPELGNGADLLPLTFRQRPSASSHAAGREPLYATDDSVFSWWQYRQDDPAPWILIPLCANQEYWIHSVRLLWRDIGMETLDGINPGPFQYVIEYRTANDASAWHPLVDASDNRRDLVVDYRTFAPVKADALRLRILGAPEGITPGLVSFTAFGKDISDAD